MRTVNLIVIHCSATKCNRRFTVNDLENCHNARFHNKGVGYHYYIERDGQVFQTRSEDEVGMHARHYNAHSIGICYEGGLDENGQPCDTRTPAQTERLTDLLTILHKMFPNAKIVGHRNLPGTTPKACPCFNAHEVFGYIEKL
jgi:N-acetyl-anhydromuramyl-L-alanine amidase AmpD